jgi:3-methylcrotonyl-CoA carboxylase alpha subunit
MVIKKLLIANRGEIALRIIATAKRMGIRTVAIYHAADNALPFVNAADEALNLGEGALSDTYLNGPAIVQLAKTAGADAIHPGYGFLSENAEFANLCRQSGIAFVGPSPEVIAVMGDKTTSRCYAQSLGLPVVQGYEGNPSEILAQVQNDDFPLLVKPSLGGGGKGMKVARNFDELRDALETASRESLRYFNSDSVFVEHLVLFPRHIEVQIIADGAGNVLHLFDRECTLQRRFQKVVEEAPSPSLNENQRREAYDMSIRLAKECGYINAGTVEFLLDSKGKLYFLEMNTRIQVEHPVTEAIVGIDIVELQLLVAMGRELPLKQSNIKVNGAAIELRLIAEDVEKGFLPSVGRIAQLSIPSSARFDRCYQNGNEITPHFDSLIGKIIVHGATRKDAMEKSLRALEQSAVHGVKTNLSFLRQLLLSKPFIENRIYVDFIDRSLADMVAGIKDFKHSVPDHLLVAAFLSIRQSSWQLFYQNTLCVDDRLIRFYAHSTMEEYQIAIGNTAKNARVKKGKNKLAVSIDGAEHMLFFSEENDGITLTYKGIDFGIKTRKLNESAYSPNKMLSGYEKTITSPLNGKIVEVKVEKGQKVRKGTLLLVVESMKMENSIFAPADATIAEVLVKVSQQVQGGSTLLNLE